MLILCHQYILPVTSVVLFIGAFCHGDLFAPSTTASPYNGQWTYIALALQSGLCVPRNKSETKRNVRMCKERKNTEQDWPSGVHLRPHKRPYKMLHVFNHGGLLEQGRVDSES